MRSPPTQPFISEIRLFAFGFAPHGWEPCDGRLLGIADHQPLFAMVGWNFGGDGRTTFALPDLHVVDQPDLVRAIAVNGLLAPEDDSDE